jgi:predicted tellurium resistance membrane protein TerC
MERFPYIITAGGMLLGWIAGQMAVTDPAIKQWFSVTKPMEYGAAVFGALLVLCVGLYLQKRNQTAH